MEKFMQRENVDVGYGKSTRNPSPDSEDLDFNDVFGGPPRRFSMQEVRARYSFGESEEETASSPWKEKPVFGEETTPRRRKGADFFDDIFKGGDRDRDRDRDSVFGSNPSSRIMSPKADPLATSLPASAQFSLPARLSKGVDLPTFGSHINHGEKRVDGGSNGFGSPLSRFSNEAARSMDDSNRNEVHPVARQSPLSNEASFMSEKDTNNDDSIGNQFHFSIYKWAGRGVPMLMPLVIENNLKSKDNMKYDKSVSSNGRMERRSSSVRRKASSAAREDVTSKEEQNHVHLSESKSKSSSNDSVGVNEEQVKSVDESNVGEKIEKQVPVKIREGFKSEVKPLHAFLVDGEEPGETKDAYDSGRKGVDSNNANSRVTQRKSAASKGKVKEFVQIFNQEADVEGSRSSRRGNVGIDPKGINEVSSNPPKVKQQVNLDNVDKKPDVSSKVVENLKNDEAQQGFFPTRTSSHTTTRSSSTLRRSFSAGAQSHRDLKMSLENLDDPLEESFVVQELSDDHESVTQKESFEETKAIDAKIRQWSVGKKGNIRSLLSTLQYVLWPESGWKAVPLVDLIEANSVKRAYQKALLRLHPDKLQQKGAAFHHKYIAEKVFDILQEAWDHFNTCSSLGI